MHAPSIKHSTRMQRAIEVLSVQAVLHFRPHKVHRRKEREAARGLLRALSPCRQYHHRHDPPKEYCYREEYSSTRRGYRDRRGRRWRECGRSLICLADTDLRRTGGERKGQCPLHLPHFGMKMCTKGNNTWFKVSINRSLWYGGGGFVVVDDFNACFVGLKFEGKGFTPSMLSQSCA